MRKMNPAITESEEQQAERYRYRQSRNSSGAQAQIARLSIEEWKATGFKHDPDAKSDRRIVRVTCDRPDKDELCTTL